ncbi:hypothetical protein N7509_012913 [Penicillium cosmopolitanum]|uniref:Uncharacterized protein n=1 Tax=Penicillium cosmopolitanum TaxID=1131564 RepID=A0A9W9SC99_9EURO|nr:uncharacterized protein N7509_012913 [Penicillium cosmopolitanum]KAJ5376027.1 hypothetical protein N7509_012913 [Penicillium cosmopolitanum]
MHSPERHAAHLNTVGVLGLLVWDMESTGRVPLPFLHESICDRSILSKRPDPEVDGPKRGTASTEISERGLDLDHPYTQGRQNAIKNLEEILLRPGPGRLSEC